MDPVTLAAMGIAALSPLVVKGAEEVSKTAFKDAYQAIKKRFAKKPDKQSALEAFEKNPTTGAPAFQAALAEHLATDVTSSFACWQRHWKNPAPVGSLVGKIEAEKVVVAEKINTVNM